jgi:hypothetical protein
MLRGWAGIAVSAIVALGSTSVIGRSPVTSLQALITAPDRYANRAVTVTGRFRGRVGGDASPSLLPPPNRSRWDFLLNENGAAVWVSGIRPAGWDFDLDPRSAADARKGPWLEVTGTVRVAGRGRSCSTAAVCDDLWIQASDLRAARAPEAGFFELPIRPAVQPPVVVFNDPVKDEADVTPATGVRLQFSRAMIPETFSERIRIGYASGQGMRSDGAPPFPTFSALYSDATRSLAITFAAPLAPGRTVRVELLDGIVAANGRAFEPWGFSFTTGR